jgi:hypothetical protein
MMSARTVGLAAFLASSLAGAAGPLLPQGTFEGRADWRGAGGASGSYTVERSFEGNTMHARFAWTEPESRSESLAMTFAVGADPTFDVADAEGRVVGRGYCHDGACAWRADFGAVSVDESFRWTGDGMTVLGSKSGPGFSVVWKETLRTR